MTFFDKTPIFQMVATRDHSLSLVPGFQSPCGIAHHIAGTSIRPPKSLKIIHV
jgi:hypothetical protein